MATQPPDKQVTVMDIDTVLNIIAAACRFSSPELKTSSPFVAGANKLELLTSLYQRLQSREMKWFTRLILKNYAPVIIPEMFIYKSYHYLLPHILRVQDSLPAAIRLLQHGSLKDKRSMPRELEQVCGLVHATRDLKPCVGVKIGRQQFFKARSIKHCCDMAQNRRMSVEKKYDGEYCQIHVDLTKGLANCIKIFSKSGKDSTTDRIKIHK